MGTCERMCRRRPRKEMSLFGTEGAAFSQDRRYRYKLWRIWNPALRHMVFVLLNPSTADEINNDPTVARCIERASLLGYGGCVVLNIFAWRSTDPHYLYALVDPIGPENDQYILDEASKPETGLVLCGWGQHGKLHQRGEYVLDLIRHAGKNPHCLKMNNDGTPGHPLYLPYSMKPWPIPED